jgi:uncharacterized protein (TIGR02284 family)
MVTQHYTPNIPVVDADEIQLKDDIEKLNYLLRMEHNAIRGYEHAIENVGHESLKSRLEAYRQAHSERATRLSNLINANSGEPVMGGTIAGALHRNWLDLKAAAASNNAEAVLEAVVFGERNLDEAYEDMLNNGELASQRLHDTLARMHQEVHSLRETTESLAQTYGVS